MTTNGQQPRIGVLIDADNAQAAAIGRLLSEIGTYGIASIKRAYGDWTTPKLSGWKSVLNQHAIQPLQQFSYSSGKNATDSALIIDAMDLLYTGKLQAFCIVSSDSDFTRLATRLRESGMTVYGVGRKGTPRAFVSACDKFIYTETLLNVDDAASNEHAEEAAPAAAVPAPPKASPKSKKPITRPTAKKTTKELQADERLVQLLKEAIRAAPDDDGWSTLSAFAHQLSIRSPEFSAKAYGYPRLFLLLSATGLFEFEERKPSRGVSQKFVREIPKQRKAPVKKAARASAKGLKTVPLFGEDLADNSSAR